MTIGKPLMAGAVAAAATALLLPNGSGSVSTILGNMPAFVPIGISVAAASAVAEVGKQYIIPKDTTSQIIISGAKPVLTGAAAVAAMYVLGGQLNDYMTPFILGAGSEIAGDYTYDNFVSPYMSGKSEVKA